MPGAAQFISFFQVVSILGSALTVVKLITSGLYRRYRIFLAYFVFRILYSGGMWAIARMHGLAGQRPGQDGTSSYLYFHVFIYCEPLQILFYILVVIELYRLVLERYPGLYTLGRWAMYAAIFISAGISILTFLRGIAPHIDEPSNKLMAEIATERGVDFALVIFILLIVWFLGRYPVPLSRNVVVHTSIYAIFFLTDASMLLWRTFSGYGVTENFNLLQTAISCACTIAWWLLLSARGEEVTVHVPKMRPDSEERILQQLEMLNATMMKVSRK